VTFAPEAEGAAVRPSPNRDERRPAAPVDILLLHYTGMLDDEGALERLCDPAAKVSSHYLVFEDGRVAQLVPETARAWHAGMSFWAGERDINSRSIGIEICNPGHEHGYRDFPERQVAALVRLCREIVARHPIPADRVLAHSDVAPARKMDPGERFPWAFLAQQGIGLWIDPAPPGGGAAFGPGHRGGEVHDLKTALARFGYGVSEGDLFDEATHHVVAAFQRHFRPERVDGLADPSTIRGLSDLLSERGRAAHRVMQDGNKA